MAILRVYHCARHGFTECFDDEPHCRNKRCKEDLREMIASPNIIHQGTKNIDKTTRQLAADYRMTNIKSTREGEAQKGEEQKPGSGVIWGQAGKMSLDAAVKGQLASSVRGEAVGIKRPDMGPLRGPAVTSATPEQILKAKV